MGATLNKEIFPWRRESCRVVAVSPVTYLVDMSESVLVWSESMAKSRETLFVVERRDKKKSPRLSA